MVIGQLFLCSTDGALITVFPYEKGKKRVRFLGLLQDE